MTTHYIHPLNKHQLIIRDILCAHNPKYQGREQELMEDWGLFNVERIVEEQMAALGGYDRVDSFLELAVKLSTVSSPYEYRELDTPKNTLFDWT